MAATEVRVVAQEEEGQCNHQGERSRLARPLHVDPPRADGGKDDDANRDEDFADEDEPGDDRRHRAVDQQGDDRHR